jgi:hypothetical protein
MDADSVLVLLYLAKKYNVDTLVRRCVAFLLDNLCVDTACFLVEQGHIFNEEGLRKTALQYINVSKSDSLHNAVLESKNFCNIRLRLRSWVRVRVSIT